MLFWRSPTSHNCWEAEYFPQCGRGDGSSAKKMSASLCGDKKETQIGQGKYVVYLRCLTGHLFKTMQDIIICVIHRCPQVMPETFNSVILICLTYVCETLYGNRWRLISIMHCMAEKELTTYNPLFFVLTFRCAYFFQGWNLPSLFHYSEHEMSDVKVLNSLISPNPLQEC